jgi:hypothetical protein
MLSAAHSRVGLIAIRTSMAARGTRAIMTSVPVTPMPLLPLPLQCRLPENIPNYESIEMAPALVAVTVMTSVSRYEGFGKCAEGDRTSCSPR